MNIIEATSLMLRGAKMRPRHFIAGNEITLKNEQIYMHTGPGVPEHRFYLEAEEVLGEWIVVDEQ